MERVREGRERVLLGWGLVVRVLRVGGEVGGAGRVCR